MKEVSVLEVVVVVVKVVRGAVEVPTLQWLTDTVAAGLSCISEGAVVGMGTLELLAVVCVAVVMELLLVCCCFCCSFNFACWA